MPMEQNWSNSLSTTAPTYYSPYNMSSPAGNSSMQLYNARQPTQQTSAGQRVYNGQGGSFSQELPSNVGGIDPNTGRRIEARTDLGGAWQDASGRTIQDLQGYLGKGQLQKTGADVSDYQNQLRGLISDPSKIQQTAGYQFAVDQGNQAINRSAAAKGMGNSGGVLAELARYGQGMASQEYGNQVNRLSGLVGQGQQFGISSGYFDELNPQKSSGGGSRTAASTPQTMQSDSRGMGGAGYNFDADPWFQQQRARR